MINNDAIKQALGTLERHAPAEDEVLAGMRTGIARRRKRRQVASMVGVAGAAGVVALGVVIVAPDRGSEHAGFTGAAAPTTPVKIATPPAPPALPFTVGWVPEGYHLDSWQAGSTDGSAQYVGTKDFQTVVVWVSAQPRAALHEGDREEPATIAGRAGVIRRLAPDAKETQLHWQLADGRWAMVGGRAPTVSLSTLHQVADSVTAKATPMPVPFSLTTLPDGYREVSWMGGGGGPMPGSLTLCRSAIQPRAESAQPPDCISVAVSDGTAPAVTWGKDPGNPTSQHEIPIDQERTTDGVLTRATADGTMVVAQLDPGHWVQAFSQSAGVDLLRQVVVTARS